MTQNFCPKNEVHGNQKRVSHRWKEFDTWKKKPKKTARVKQKTETYQAPVYRHYPVDSRSLLALVSSRFPFTTSPPSTRLPEILDLSRLRQRLRVFQRVFKQPFFLVGGRNFSKKRKRKRKWSVFGMFSIARSEAKKKVKSPVLLYLIFSV